MANLLIKVIFKVLNFLSSIFFLPIKPIMTLIPGLASFFTAITTYMGYGLNYIDFFLKLLMIPKSVVVTAFSFSLGIFAFNITLRVVGMGMAIYHYFKP